MNFRNNIEGINESPSATTWGWNVAASSGVGIMFPPLL